MRPFIAKLGSIRPLRRRVARSGSLSRGIRSLRVPSTLLFAAALHSGCIGELIESEQNGYLVVRGAHHGEAKAGEFPEFTGQSGAREFVSNRGWNILLTEGLVMTTKVELMRCSKEELKALDKKEEDDDESGTEASESDDSDSDDEESDSSEEDYALATEDDESSSEEEDDETEEDDSESDGDDDDKDADDFDFNWVEVPLKATGPESLSQQADLSAKRLAEDVTIKSNHYCWLKMTFGVFEEPDDHEEDDELTDADGHEISDSIFGRSAYVRGVARESSDSEEGGESIRFTVGIDDELSTIVNIPSSTGDSLFIPRGRQPVSIVVSKVYDRIFDGVDFLSDDYEKQIAEGIRRTLTEETYVSLGARPHENLAKSGN